MSLEKTLVDFIAKGSSRDEWRMVLVEEGPWAAPLEVQLRRVQDRLYDCLDAAIDGQLAENFPESYGKKIVIQLDCYNLPRQEITDFFNKFSNGVLATNDYQEAFKKSLYVKNISFDINFPKSN